LALSKTLVNDDGGLKTVTDFELTITDSGVASVVADGVANTVLANTALTISELDLPGYTEGTWSCVDSSSLTTGLPTAGVATGEDIDLTIADFELSVDSTLVVNGALNTVQANSPIVIGELDLPGYTEGTWECIDSGYSANAGSYENHIE